MSGPLIAKAGAVAGSLAGYYLARSRGVTNWHPYMAIGGLAGMALVEVLLKLNSQSNQRRICQQHSIP